MKLDIGTTDLLCELRDDGVLIATLNRPETRNAFSAAMGRALGNIYEMADTDDAVRVVVVTGTPPAFCAGADFSHGAEVFERTEDAEFTSNPVNPPAWKIRKPVIAAVSGYALGGGCELAMMCDMIIAADNAKFAQPEIKLGIVPGSGGTQRLTRAVSKSKAMDLCLTGRMMDAAEAERSGLVARVYPAAQLMAETMAIAQTIAAMPLLTLMMVKESVNAAYETTLSEGIRYERRLFHACFGTEDQKEGMTAFLEKRPAQFKNR